MKAFFPVSPRFSALLVAGVLFVASVPGQAAPKPVFEAGAATSNITPPLGTSLNGSMRDRTARDVHDELHARCLALRDGTTTLVIVVCDSCMIPREVYDEAKRLASAATGISGNHMMMSATHTHTAPTASPVFQSEPDPAYQRFLSRRIADGVRRAVGNLEPARIGWGTGKEPGQVFNRRWFLKEGAMPKNPFGEYDRVKMNPPRGKDILVRPAGPIDPEVNVVAVQAEDGRPIALLANYSLHYVGGGNGSEVSADYYGMFAGMLEDKLGREDGRPPFVALLSNGTSGDINNINFREPRPRGKPYEQMNRVAEDVSKEALRVYGNLEFRDRARLGARVAEVRLGVRRPEAAEMERARDITSRARNFPRMDTLEEIYARETLHMADYPKEVELLVQAFRIGDLAIGAIPCETFVEIGLELKARSPFGTTFTHSLANGYNGYLPTVPHHELGGYETWRAKSSYLEVQAAPRIVETLSGLFRILSEED